MTLRDLYNMVTASTISPDAEVEVVNGELQLVAAPSVRPTPPPAPDLRRPKRVRVEED